MTPSEVVITTVAFERPFVSTVKSGLVEAGEPELGVAEELSSGVGLGEVEGVGVAEVEVGGFGATASLDGDVTGLGSDSDPFWL